jgi:hypothetical protein
MVCRHLAAQTIQSMWYRKQANEDAVRRMEEKKRAEEEERRRREERRRLEEAMTRRIQVGAYIVFLSVK